MEDSDLVRLTIVESDVDANYIQSALEEHDIKVLMSGNEASAFGIALDGPDEIELFVNKEDLEKASELVEALLEDEGEPIPAWTCKRCGEEVDEGFGICWSCGAEYPGNDAEATESSEQE